MLTFNEEQWDICLPRIMAVYNRTRHNVTKETPYYVFYGREYVGANSSNFFSIDTSDVKPDVRRYIRDLINETNLTKDLILEASYMDWKKNKVRYDSNRTIDSRDFFIGDKVWVFVGSTKMSENEGLGQKWYGPMRILKVNESTCKLALPQGSRMHDMVHKDRLVKYISQWEGPKLLENDNSIDDSVDWDLSLKPLFDRIRMKRLERNTDKDIPIKIIDHRNQRSQKNGLSFFDYYVEFKNGNKRWIDERVIWYKYLIRRYVNEKESVRFQKINKELYEETPNEELLVSTSKARHL